MLYKTTVQEVGAFDFVIIKKFTELVRIVVRAFHFFFN